MTCNDKNGQPDLVEAQNRTRNYGNSSGTRAGAVGKKSNFEASPFGNPYISEEEMREFNQQFQLMDSFSAVYSGATATNSHTKFANKANKPTVSAAPLEHMGDNSKALTQDKYLCPKCREGHLRKIKGRNGAFWGCTNYPRCTATFDDEKNMPLIN